MFEQMLISSGLIVLAVVNFYILLCLFCSHEGRRNWLDYTMVGFGTMMTLVLEFLLFQLIYLALQGLYSILTWENIMSNLGYILPFSGGLIVTALVYSIKQLPEIKSLVGQTKEPQQIVSRVEQPVFDFNASEFREAHVWKQGE